MEEAAVRTANLESMRDVAGSVHMVKMCEREVVDFGFVCVGQMVRIHKTSLCLQIPSSLGLGACVIRAQRPGPFLRDTFTPRFLARRLTSSSSSHVTLK